MKKISSPVEYVIFFFIPSNTYTYLYKSEITSCENEILYGY